MFIHVFKFFIIFFFKKKRNRWLKTVFATSYCKSKLLTLFINVIILNEKLQKLCTVINSLLNDSLEHTHTQFSEEYYILVKKIEVAGF